MQIWMACGDNWTLSTPTRGNVLAAFNTCKYGQLLHDPKCLDTNTPQEQESKTGQIEQGVCHTMALPFTLSIIRQKKNYENSNISPCENVIFKKNPIVKKKPKSFKILL